jgi:hypothetical protein
MSFDESILHIISSHLLSNNLYKMIISNSKHLFEDGDDNVFDFDQFINDLSSHSNIKILKKGLTKTGIIYTQDVDKHIFDLQKTIMMEFVIGQSLHMTFLIVINRANHKLHIFDKSKLTLTNISNKEMINTMVLQLIIEAAIPKSYYIQNFDTWYRENAVESIIELFRTKMLESMSNSDILEQKLKLFTTKKTDSDSFLYWKKKLSNDKICNYSRSLI